MTNGAIVLSSFWALVLNKWALWQSDKNFLRWPWGMIFPVLAISRAAGVRVALARREDRRAFLASCAYLAGMLASVVVGVYPMVLPARNPEFSLTVGTAKAGAYGLRIGLMSWVIGMLLAAVYFTFGYRSFAGRVVVDGRSHEN